MEDFSNYTIHNEIFSITRAALMLNCSPATIKRWYKWADKTGRTICELGLPSYVTDTRGTWYFNLNDIKQLHEFRKNLKWGQMSEFNKKYYWTKKKGESNE